MFLIVLVLIQRGKGGGLAGALGGMGGQSAFGTKAGDLFTRITIGVAGFWILLCIVCVIVLPKVSGGGPLGAGGAAGPSAPTTSPPRRPRARPARRQLRSAGAGQVTRTPTPSGRRRRAPAAKATA